MYENIPEIIQTLGIPLTGGLITVGLVIYMGKLVLNYIHNSRNTDRATRKEVFTLYHEVKEDSLHVKREIKECRKELFLCKETLLNLRAEMSDLRTTIIAINAELKVWENKYPPKRQAIFDLRRNTDKYTN